jgi:hypothetical protein
MVLHGPWPCPVTGPASFIIILAGSQTGFGVYGLLFQGWGGLVSMLLGTRNSLGVSYILCLHIACLCWCFLESVFAYLVKYNQQQLLYNTNLFASLLVLKISLLTVRTLVHTHCRLIRYVSSPNCCSNSFANLRWLIYWLSMSDNPFLVVLRPVLRSVWPPS